MGEIDRHRLQALSPLDGRYGKQLTGVAEIFSEEALMKQRVGVEVAWFSLLGSGVLPDVEPLSDRAQEYLKIFPDQFTTSDALDIKDIEGTINHDVNAVVAWLKRRLAGGKGFDDHLELIHYGATSEDINNLAYGIQSKQARDQIVLPNLHSINQDLELKALQYADLPMLSHTHGQAATPTTLGKEFAVFAERVLFAVERIGAVAMRAKFNGATGNLAGLHFAYPEVNWPAVTAAFVRSRGFEPARATTQIEPHDWASSLMNETALANTILKGLADDMWSYIAMNYLKLKTVAEEVGSSTMPHKVNPIDFENSRGSFGIANALFVGIAGSLPVSRMQRDLSDSTTQRYIGEAYGASAQGYRALKRGLGKIDPNYTELAADLDAHYDVLTEALQITMRRYKIRGSYDAIKQATRGHSLDAASYRDLVNSITDLPEEARARLLELTPATYTGYSEAIAMYQDLEDLPTPESGQ